MKQKTASKFKPFLP